MSHFTVGHRLPDFLAAPLFGDRRRHGLRVVADDPCWREWEQRYLDFYYANQKKSVGKTVNDAGYGVLRQIDLTGKTVLEIGPGDIAHLDNLTGVPRQFLLADVYASLLERSAQRLAEKNIRSDQVLLQKGEAMLPFLDNSVEVVISFYSLEHLFPLAPYLEEIRRILAPGGLLVGAIPAEGGLAWGLGRYLTSRRWLKSHTSIDPDKIICWEHPNFADEILATLDRLFERKFVNYWPLRLPAIDLNLVIQFAYRK